MSLFSSIQLANNALRAQQIGLQVVGQNIANASTPGYIREEVIFGTAATQDNGRVLLGMGVNVLSVVQKIDHFIENRLRGASSDRAAAETQEQTFLQLETLIGELGDNDLSTSLNNFFNSIHDILSEPASDGVRKLAALQGQALAGDIRRLAQRALALHTELNNRVANSATDINRLIEEIRTLNLRISQVESSDTSASDAVGLRDQRLLALEKLAGLIDITVNEQVNGSVNVLHQGEFLVSAGISRPLEVTLTADSRGQLTAGLRIVENQLNLNPQAGETAGMIAARDDIVGRFLDQLDNFARALIFEFNRVFSSGQGITGYRELRAESSVTSTTAALDAAGLSFEPQSGSFEVLVRNVVTGVTHRTRVNIDLNGFDNDDTTLEGLRAALDAINGISATINSARRLEIRSDSAADEFAFADDTSGVLAALGINTFFTGSSALSIGVNQVIVDDPRKFAGSRSGIGEDSDNAVALADFLDRPLGSQGQATLAALYDGLVGEVTQASAVAKATAEGFRVYEQTVKGQKLAISGVNLDEEVVNMLSFQRAYQVAARYISTLNQLLEMLVNL